MLYFSEFGWKEYHVLMAQEVMIQIPIEERLKAVALLDQPGIPFPQVIAILRNLKKMKVTARRRIWKLSESSDPRDRGLALTKAAELPPMPDPRVYDLDEALKILRRSAKLFTDDPYVAPLNDVIKQVSAIRSGIKRQHEERMAS